MMAAAFGLAAFPVLMGLPAPAAAQSTFQTGAPSAILVDFATGRILFEKDSEKSFAPVAS